MDYLNRKQESKMKYIKILPLILILFLTAIPLKSQDVRLTSTRVADLLAQMPARDNEYTAKLMNDMLSLGDAGLKMICDQVIPSGSGDDTKARFAIESYSRFLSMKQGDDRLKWEKLCIGYTSEAKDYNVKDFFMKQLQVAGGAASVEAMKNYLGDRDLCAPAIAVIKAVGGQNAEEILAGALKDEKNPCTSTILNILADWKSSRAVIEYQKLALSGDINVKAAAYRALAASGSPEAYKILTDAARSVNYRWEHSGATEALLLYAINTGEKGNLKTADKICKTLLKSCNDRSNIQYKTEALQLVIKMYGKDAVSDILDALASTDKSYRNAALMYSLSIKDNDLTKILISYFRKAQPAVRPEIIHNLGLRKDTTAAGFVKAALTNPDLNVRKEAAPVLVALEGQDAVGVLIDYLAKSTGTEDQEAAGNALKTVLDDKTLPLLLPALKDASDAGKASIIGLLAWSRSCRYFQVVFPYTSSGNKDIRSSAFSALANLASQSDEDKLIDLLLKTDDPAETAAIQMAIANAAGKVKDPESRANEILLSLEKGKGKEKLIPVLALTGGRKALATVLNEFENGSVEMRSVCFRALSTWKDMSAASALYEICASGNKNYGDQAFSGYVNIVKSAPVTDDQRLLLFRKIMPYALTPEKKITVIDELGKIRTYPALFYTSKFLESEETRSAAAKAVMYIALPSSGSKAGMYGTMVRDILSKAVPSLTGPESDYNRELINKYLASMPQDQGFYPMFNGTDLAGWQGLVQDPVARQKMKASELAKKQVEANKKMLENWSVKDGCIWFSGSGDNLCSIKEYGDFELYVDWKITKKGDSGIYLRGSPQVQIWDTSRVEVGAQVGSGGLYNNQKNPSKPLVVADNPIDDWNTFRIVMIGEKVSVWLNGQLTVDNVVLENYWDRSIPIFPKGAIELQAHGNQLAFRDIFVREINEKEYNLTAEEKAEGFESLFNGKNIDNWVGDKEAYAAEDGMIVVKPDRGKVGNLYTSGEYSDFIFRFEFQLTPAANNGLGIRAPLTGDAAYVGMELQILDDSAPVYANLQPYQYHGSVYGVIPSRRGYQKPVGEWNYEEVVATGTHIRITLNGTVIVDGDIAGPRDNGTMDHNNHPGLKNKTGHIGFLGHGSEVRFRNIRIKDLSK